MRKMDREIERAFPEHTIVKRSGHIKIYDAAGCLVCSTSSTPSDTRTWANMEHQVRRHVCPALAAAPAAALASAN